MAFKQATTLLFDSAFRILIQAFQDKYPFGIISNYLQPTNLFIPTFSIVLCRLLQNAQKF